jgi:hypothetical protein
MTQVELERREKAMAFAEECVKKLSELFPELAPGCPQEVIEGHPGALMASVVGFAGCVACATPSVVAMAQEKIVRATVPLMALLDEALKDNPDAPIELDFSIEPKSELSHAQDRDAKQA